MEKSLNKNLNYDVVVIGAGNGGLIAATKCAKKGLKTLLIEQHNVPGGFATSFVRGRFEFEVALHELGNFGNQSLPGDVYNIFEELGIKLDWCKISDAFRIILKNESLNYDFTLPFGKHEFAKKCDEYEPGCYQSVINFIDVCQNCYEAVQYISSTRGNPDPEVLKSMYPNYLTCSGYTLEQGLKKIKIPKLIRFILESYWIYLGTSPKNLVFSLYCIMFYEYIKFNAYIPKYKSHDISQTIANRFQELGGTIWYNTKALKIDVKNNMVTGVLTNNGYINTKHIISNASPHIVYGKLIDKKLIPDIDKKVTANRAPGSQGFCIYIGLNKSVEELNLKDYSYFMFNDIDHENIYKSMDNLNTNKNYIVVALNVANPDCSPKGTSILSFTTLFNDAWNNIDIKDYFKTKDKIANMLIEDFENKTKIKIKPYIEEIEIATPITFARYTGSMNGAIYGTKMPVSDSTYVRGKNIDNFYTIKGLRFCGGSSIVTHGYSITYVTGTIAAGKTFGDIAKEK